MTVQSRSTAPMSAASGSCPKTQFAPRPYRVIRTEKKAGQWIGIDVTFEPHPGSVLNVQHDAVPVVASWHDAFRTCLLGQPTKIALIELVQPGQALPHLVRVNPAARDVRHMLRFT